MRLPLEGMKKSTLPVCKQVLLAHTFWHGLTPNF
jgi:hypothetical protein